MMQVDCKSQIIVFWGSLLWNVAFSSLGQSSYLEVTDYQLFMVNTVEKGIGFYL